VIKGEYNSLKSVGEEMLQLMEKHKGVGLAAPQVGLDIQLFVASPTGLARNGKIYINPMFLELNSPEIGDESCLSIPNVTLPIKRYRNAVISAVNADGHLFYEEASGWLSRIWQHEADHLNGILIIDRFQEQNPNWNSR
jgi:peptide deformylase